MLELSVAHRTHPGLVRQVNEDALIARMPVFLVADGMGGHDAGDVASALAIEAFALIPDGSSANIKAAGAAYAQARADVAGLAASRERGAGCTLSGVIVIEHGDAPHWLVLNVGDSRVYSLENATLTQLTIDHTLRDEYLAGGADEDDPRLPGRNVITRALGSVADEVDTWVREVVADQRILVCSDGLHGEVSAEQIRATLLTVARAEEAAQNLVDLALAAGGSDNISVIVIDVIAGAVEASVDDATADTLDVTREL